MLDFRRLTVQAGHLPNGLGEDFSQTIGMRVRSTLVKAKAEAKGVEGKKAGSQLSLRFHELVATSLRTGHCTVALIPVGTKT